MDYEKLKETYNKNGTTYRLLKRTEKVAMYQQFMPDETPIGYEVFSIRIQPEFRFPKMQAIKQDCFDAIDGLVDGVVASMQVERN